MSTTHNKGAACRGLFLILSSVYVNTDAEAFAWDHFVGGLSDLTAVALP